MFWYMIHIYRKIYIANCKSFFARPNIGISKIINHRLNFGTGVIIINVFASSFFEYLIIK